MSKNHRIFSPIIASSLALTLGVNVASATSCSSNNSFANCTPATDKNSGMWYGVALSNMSEITMGGSGSTTAQLKNFGWDTATEEGVLKPQDYNTLNFEFSSKVSNVSGAANTTNKSSYDIQIPIITSATWNIFLLNAGANILRSNLNFVFDTTPNEDQYYYLNAGGLEGNLTLKNNGHFKAYLTGSITGTIDNVGADADFFFTSPSEDKNKPITLGRIIARKSSSSRWGAANRLTFSNVIAEINDSITTEVNAGNAIILDSTKGPTKLTINGENISGDGGVHIGNYVGIEAKGKGNILVFNKDLKINILSEARGSTKYNTDLTFVNRIKRKETGGYTANLLEIWNSEFGNNLGGLLRGVYRMKIQGDGTINPNDIVYNPDKSHNDNIKVAIIKKNIGETSGDATQAVLRGRGIVDLGDKTVKTLTRTLEFIDFAYFVAETDEKGDPTRLDKDYITYFLDKNTGTPPTEEEVGPTPTPNPTPNPELEFQQDVRSNIALSTTGLYLANFNSLNKRMGELRDNNHSQGIWARIFNGQQSNSIGLKSSANFVTVQAGYDYAFGFEGANNFTGFALSYSHSQSKFKDRATAIIESIEYFTSIDSLKSDLVEVALYNAYVADSGWYNDTVAKFSYLLNQMGISGSDKMSGSNKGDINTYAFILSNEVGYRFKLGGNKEWYIDPQAELGFGYFGGQDLKFKGNDYSLNNFGTMDSLLTLRGRVGTSFGYDFKNFTSKENGLSAKLYLGIFGEFDYFNGGDVKFKAKEKNETAKRAINADARAVINVGTNLEVKESTRIYVDFESSFGGKITTDYKINAGVRYSFGENTNYKSSNAVQKDNEVKEAPIKLQEGEEEGEE